MRSNQVQVFVYVEELLFSLIKKLEIVTRVTNEQLR